MLSNLFVNVERIVHEEILQKAQVYPSPTTEYYEYVKNLLEDDSTEIFNEINTIRTSNASRGETLWKVHAYHEKLDNLLGTIGNLLEELNLTIGDDNILEGSWQALIMWVADFLSQIIAFLHGRHPDLFNHEMIMAHFSVQLLIKSRSEKIKEELQTLPEGSERYQVFNAILIGLEDPTDEICYRHIGYFDKVIADVVEILKQETEDKQAVEKIKALLWKINFNHPAYVALLRNGFIASLGDTQGKERVKKCLEIKKEVKINKHAYGIHLYPDSLSLSSQIETWLDTELNCTRALLVTESIIATNPFSDFKIQTPLSAPQLAGLLRLFAEKGLFRHEDRRKMLHFFATHFLTGTGKNISPATLTRYYDKGGEEVAAKRLEEILSNKNH